MTITSVQYSVDDCDAMIEDGIEIGSTRFEVREKLDSINKEFKVLNDLVLNIEKLLRVGGITSCN